MPRNRNAFPTESVVLPLEPARRAGDLDASVRRRAEMILSFPDEGLSSTGIRPREIVLPVAKDKLALAVIAQ